MLDLQLGQFLLFAIIVDITPGQDMALITQTVLTYGKRAAYWNILGMALAACIHATLAIFTGDMLFQRHPGAKIVAMIAGSGYLAWLGGSGLYQLVKTRMNRTHSSSVAGEDSIASANTLHRSPWFHIRRGFLSTLTNVKVMLFFLLVLTTFIPRTASYLQRGLLLCCIHITLANVWLFTFASFLGILRQKLLQPRVRRALEGATSLVMLALAMKLLVDVLRTFL